MARSQEGEDSVYDFLYVDANRIGVLLSQFGVEGVLTELTRSVSDTSEAGGGFDVKLAKADTKESSTTGLTRRFDPRWLMPLMFLRDARDMLNKDITKAHIGQLVLIEGALSVLDAAMIPKVYASKVHAEYHIRLALEASMEGWRNNPKNANLSPAQRKKAEKDFRDFANANLRASVETFNSFSFGPQFTIKNDAATVWGTLGLDGLIGKPEDIFLKHGTVVPGRWYALGIFDAEPSPIDPIIEIPMGAPKELQNLAPTLTNQANMMRTRIGRPEDAYGMTTLLIFRPVG